MNVVAIVQARMESTRLPGKVLQNLCGKPVLGHIVSRIENSKLINNIVIATSINSADNQIELFAKNNRIDYFRGSQLNVLERYYKCAVHYKADVIIRFTGDNALIDAEIVDEGIEYFLKHQSLDYLYYREGLPLGMAVEIFKFSALESAYKNAQSPECLEHVTPYIYKNDKLFKVERAKLVEPDYSNLRWTLDTIEDFELINCIYQELYYSKKSFGYTDVIKAYRDHKEWLTINAKINQVKISYRGEDND